MGQIKWIGFDMDDCLANAIPAYRFVKAFGINKTAPLFVNSETSGQTWILRSGFQKIVDEVSKVVSNGSVYGAFLYSNNTSKVLVDFVRTLLNLMSNGVNPFKVGFHRKFVARTGNRIKTYEDICNCLHILDMPLPSTMKCLVFFDDSDHILSSEISLYKRVEPYRGYTPVQCIAEALDSLSIDKEIFHHALVAAVYDECEREEKIKERKEQDPSVFIDTIQMLIK